MITRQFANLMAFVLFAALPGVTAWGQNAADQRLERLKAFPDVIVYNAKIYTMDANLTRAEAMAVRDSRIVTLGTNAAIKDLAGPKTEMIDAKGRAVLPGLVDSHTHPNLWAGEHWFGAEGDDTAKRYNDPELKMGLATGNSQAEILKSLERVITQRAKELGPGKYIVVKVFGGNSVGESRKIASPMFESPGRAGPINTQLLDALAPNNPVSLFATEGIGPTMNNTKAKEVMHSLFGYEATGIFARTMVPWEILLRGKLDIATDILKREIHECLNAQGVTTFGDRFDRSPEIIKVYRTLYERGELNARYGYFSDGGANTVQKYDRPDLTSFLIGFINRETGDFRGVGNDFMWDAGVANEAWEEGLICTKAKPLPSNAGQEGGGSLAEGLRPDCSKPINYDEKSGYESVKAGLEAGLRIGFMHGYSDGTYDAIFHMIEQDLAQKKITLQEVRDLRIGFEHNPIIRPDQIPLFAKYNIHPGFNGYQIQGDIKGGAFLKAYGEQYMNWMIPAKSLVDAGVHIAFNTDAHLGRNIPVQWKDMDYPAQWDGNIWAFMEFFATRFMPSDGVTYEKQEALDKVTLMKAATIWSAEQLLNEKNIGSLESGKLADFIILNKDYFDVPNDQIHTVKALLTALGGKVVYKSPEY
jgi:predicted amidohydrolase YtcJ